jgi:hypothetical protein
VTRAKTSSPEASLFGAKSFPAEAGPTNRVGQACGIGLSPSQEPLGNLWDRL